LSAPLQGSRMTFEDPYTVALFGPRDMHWLRLALTRL
jgi:hypothetical protein